MTNTKKRLMVVIAVGMAVFLAAAIAGVVWLVQQFNTGVEPRLPVYASAQVPSVHPGYYRSTITLSNAVYVNDYEEYALRLSNVDPTNAIGRSPFGGAKLCTIVGQEPSAYVAADVGSEMPAYAVYRNTRQPPFDWRTAVFQKMEFMWPNGSGACKRTNDPALIAEVVRMLRDGVPVAPPLSVWGRISPPMSGSISNLAGLHLYCDQLPGLIYCPEVFLGETGTVYLAENTLIETIHAQCFVHARWIPAGALFVKWVKNP